MNDFLETLFPDLSGELIEIRCLGTQLPPYQRFFSSIEEVIARQDAILAHSKKANIYFGVCPRIEKKGGKSSVGRLNCLWVDLDAKDYGEGKPEALKKLGAFPIPPTIIVDSGNGYHAYWRLKESESINTSSDILRLEAHLKGLACAIGGDSKATDLPRILRLPGTLNLKNPKNPIPVTVVSFTPENQANLSDFDSYLEIPKEAPPVIKNNPRWFLEVLTSLKDGNRNDGFARLIGKLHHGGMKPDEIKALLVPHAKKCDFALDELTSEVDGICNRYPNSSTTPSPSSPIYEGNTETETKCKAFNALSVTQLLQMKDVKVSWGVEGLIPKEAVAILASPAGYGKSWMLQDLAIECARGGKWLGHFQTCLGKVLYIDEESSLPLILQRVRQLLAGKNLSGDGLELYFAIQQGLCFSNADSVGMLRKVLGELRPDMVIIDSLIRVHRAEENSATEMSAVFDTVNELVVAYKCSFVIADHQRKMGNFAVPSNQLLRGSSEKAAFADSVLSLSKKDQTLICEHSKSRFTQPAPAFAITIEDKTPEAVSVSYIGDAEAIKQEEQETRQEGVNDFLVETIHEQWLSRKELVEQAKGADISWKMLDAGLKALEKKGLIEREDRKSNEGRGGKAAFFRKKPTKDATPLLDMETETEELENLP